MSDFIREVSEDYRRDRIIRFFKRYATVLILLAVLLVLAVVAWRVWLDRHEAGAQAANMRYEAAVALERKGELAQARAAFETIVKDGPAGSATLARMQVAQTLSVSDPEGAAKAYDAIANEEAVSPALRETARYRGAVLRLDIEDPKDFEQRYGRFSAAGFGFAGGMRELLALAAIKRNDYPAAGKFLDEIIIDPLSPPALRNRAQIFRALVTAGPATPMQGTPPAATLAPVEPPPTTGTPSIAAPAEVQSESGPQPATPPPASSAAGQGSAPIGSPPSGPSPDQPSPASPTTPAPSAPPSLAPPSPAPPSPAPH